MVENRAIKKARRRPLDSRRQCDKEGMEAAGGW